ncbi:MAG TPA: hypothetical protein VJI96_00040 [Candidatus Andersenbacteria bacterium]|nr:hypothetical protein [Candidatus Andersenbacteria bacterium]
MSNNDADGLGDLPEYLQQRLRQILLLNRTINELASGSTLFNVINLVDGERFIGLIEAKSFGKCGIVWFIPEPAGNQQYFECQFCTAIGPKPKLEFGETEDLDTDKVSDIARMDLFKKVTKSAIEATPDSNAFAANVIASLSTVTSNRVPVCVIASYNVLSDDAITLLAYHPCIKARDAIELWLAHFSN